MANLDLVLEFLSEEETERQSIAVHLRTLLARQQSQSPGGHGPIACRRPLGLFVLLPRRLAAWLAAALELPPDELERLQAEIKTACRATNFPGVKRPKTFALP